jgi:hypothetical protein
LAVGVGPRCRCTNVANIHEARSGASFGWSRPAFPRRMANPCGPKVHRLVVDLPNHVFVSVMRGRSLSPPSEGGYPGLRQWTRACVLRSTRVSFPRYMRKDARVGGHCLYAPQCRVIRSRCRHCFCNPKSRAPGCPVPIFSAASSHTTRNRRRQGVAR